MFEFQDWRSWDTLFVHLRLRISHHVWHAWLTSASAYLTAAPDDFCNEHCHVQTLKYEKWGGLAVKRKVYCGCPPPLVGGRSCAQRAFRGIWIHGRRRNEDQGQNTSPEDSSKLSSSDSGADWFPPSNTTKRVFQSLQQKGSLKLPSLRGKHIVGGKRVLA